MQGVHLQHGDTATSAGQIRYDTVHNYTAVAIGRWSEHCSKAKLQRIINWKLPSESKQCLTTVLS